MSPSPSLPVPAYPEYFADPFVLAVGSTFYAYGTGTSLVTMPDGSRRAFAILRSNDLRTWEPVGGALPVSAAYRGDSFWAPEVAAHHGRFYLYYSSAPAGHDEQHRLHVAVADHPLGPFEDQGPVLPESVGFSIDAHPFQDPQTGRWYLFFARDYFEARTGTGLAVAPLMPDLLRLAEPPRPVLRANADWQIYERDRPLYGRRWDAWHTVEGPCVIEHRGLYFCLYSGGNWQTHDYGVSFGVAEHPLGPWQHAPEAGPLVLRQRPPDLLGPGHNSYVRGPDGSEWIVYHAWDRERVARRMFLGRLEWTEQGPRCAD